MIRRQLRSTLFPYTTLFRSRKGGKINFFGGCPAGTTVTLDTTLIHYSDLTLLASFHHTPRSIRRSLDFIEAGVDRKSTRLNSSHVRISYAVFCLKKKKIQIIFVEIIIKINVIVFFFY